MPTISVIVPVYKVEKYIHRCVDSILGQTYTDFELILVDDGSPDNCGAICDEYAAKDSRVVVIHQENGGLSAARNAGIDWAFANSDSQWLTFIDSDDWVHPEYLQRLLDAAVGFNVSVSICGYAQTEGEEPEIDPETLIPSLWNTEDFYVEHNVNATVAWGKLYRKKCFQEIRYPVGKIHEDEFVTHQILLQFPSIASIHAPLYFYYFNNQGITKSTWTPKRLQALEATAQQIQFMQCHNLERAYHHAIQKHVICAAGQMLRLDKQPTAVCRYYKHRLRWHLKRMLLKYKRILPLEKYPAIYELAFPAGMYVYWIARAQIRKITKLFKHHEHNS